MTCDRCTDEAIWMPSETACMTAHCDECLSLCRYCMDDLGGSMSWPPLSERFAAKLDVSSSPTGCWLWMGAVTDQGYGTIRADGRTQYVHRVSYELHVGPIPEGLHIDHLCRVRTCVNPEHLEAVTQRVNILRGMSPGATTKRRGSCKYGHSLDDAYQRDDGSRLCRHCSRRRNAEWRQRVRDAKREISDHEEIR